MFYGLILVVHILACLILIAVILLQAGRGGGLAEAFGGAGQSIFGTRGAQVLTRATTVVAILFMCTSLFLAVLSVHRGRSLMEGPLVLPPPAPAPAPQQAADAPLEVATPPTSEAPPTPNE